MATSSVNSLSGISTGIDTSALIDAIIGMKSGNVTRMQARKDLNDKKTTALTALRTSLSALTTSLAVLQDKFNNRSVASSDANNTNVTATASGAVSGNYDVNVKTVATKGRISPHLDAGGLPTNLAVASPTDSVSSNIFTPGAPATFAIQGTDGVIKTITLDDSSNTLNGLRDKINASGAGVTASVVNMGRGDKPYQLVLTAKDTGTGTTQGVVTLVDITNQSGGSAGAAANNLGITAGTVDSLTAPTTLTGGLTSTASGSTGVDAVFTLNGIEMTRKSNTVRDAVDGITFTLKQGGQTGITTLTVAPDKTGATTAIQDFISKYNALLKDYKAASTSTKNSDGSINEAPLAGDASTRAMMANLKATLTGLSGGLPGDASYKSLASIGITSLADGGLYLNANTFQNAVGNDLAGVQKLFSFTGDSTNQVVKFVSAGPKTVTGPVDFSITKDGSGVLWGTFTRNGVTSSPMQVVNGTLTGTGDYEGLNLSVTGTGSGTLTLSRGVGRAASDLMSKFTGNGGGISTLLNSITIQNKSLTSQITVGQARLDQEREVLRKKFAQMEATVGKMKAAAGSLTGA
ncbi:MAG: flagellar filament capping protein FliD [Acidobacteria bacterium]|nr:flagellar filament capping protein FliD [Acidobacteriota bacterium]MBI3489896.1 flagellar filament capping protein FliD [Acidobacteriota bacterium]